MSENILKAELARRLNISRARVSQLVKQGMPINTDGTVGLTVAVAWLNKYSGRGSHNGSVLSGVEVLAGGPAVAQPKTRRAPAVRAPVADPIGALVKLDFARADHDWSDAALDDRAKRAALCIGAIAVRLDGPVDPHCGNAGGFQLRGDGPSGTLQGTVLDGHGFELTNTDVIRVCRDLVQEDPDTCERIDLVDALAMPICPNELPADQ